MVNEIITSLLSLFNPVFVCWWAIITVGVLALWILRKPTRSDDQARPMPPRASVPGTSHVSDPSDYVDRNHPDRGLEEIWKQERKDAEERERWEEQEAAYERYEERERQKKQEWDDYYAQQEQERNDRY